ncbi:MAG TPA: serine hydrolase [Candidatus Limnocylindrales bacterium]|nr:serine hydrolase [Candidatus Limnocylindrales bacterium]
MRRFVALAAWFLAGLSSTAAMFFTGSVMVDIAASRRSPFDAATTTRAAAPLSADVTARLDALVKAFPGHAGVWIADAVSTTPLYARDADQSVVTASLYKLGVLLEAEKRVDKGQLRYSDTITINEEDSTDEGSVYPVGTRVPLDDALEKMITMSDNGTALALWHLFGGDTIDRTLAASGINDFHVTLDRTGNTVATPRAVGTFLRLLARGELISPDVSARMLARLERQTINDRLPALLPKGVVVAHKTGNLSGLVHDAGIIYAPAGARIVVVMTSEATTGANALISEIARVVYDASPGAAKTP